jgi:CelD/BcsL family acetyltransferase involved in cellulose biosynthesis
MGLLIKERIEDVSLDEWDDVLARSVRPSPFLSRRFLLPWTRTFAAGRPMRIARWEREGRAEGFLFLCRRDESEGWELLGGDQVSDSLDAVVAEGMEGAFWAELLRSPRELLAEGPLHLHNLVEGSPSLSLLPGICGERGVSFFVEEADRSPFIPLPGSFDDYLRQLGSKERHELRRKLRRAAEADPRLSFRVTGTARELSRDFPSFVALHRKSHPEKRRFMDDRMADFFRDVAEEFLSAGRLRLAFLRGAGGDVASAFQIEHDGALLLYNSGFDPDAGDGRMSPGVVLLARCVEDAIRSGFREYDLLRGRERYKYDMGGLDRIVYRATISLP